MKILIASVTNAPLEVLEPHLQSVLWQDAQGIEIDHLYVTDPEIPSASLQVLSEAGVQVQSAGPKPIDAIHRVTDDTHEWSKETFSWLGRERQRILEHTAASGYDAVFLVDSDLLLGPETLRSLIMSNRPITSGVFWTKWTRKAPPLPQVWLRHPYELDGRGLEAHEFLERLSNRELIEVGGLGACTLIRREAIEKGVAYAPLLDGLPSGGMWEGEDRSFCIRAQRAHVGLWADAWPDIFHMYRAEDVERAGEVLEALKHRSSLSPSDGDLISVILEPAEEPNLYGWNLPLRGRLGSLDLLPAIESTLREMHRGDERFVRVRFPMWWPSRSLAGAERAIRIRLLDVKPHRLPPTLADFSQPVTFLTDPFYERIRPVEVL